jgi:phosphate acetyltransferase|eukprot:g7258.t1
MSAAAAAKSVFVAATRQHVGKSTVSLGIVSALQQKGVNVGFIKPVGQQHVPVELVDEETGETSVLSVDKDVRLINKYFGLNGNYRDMSPVVMPSGYTKQIIDNAKPGMKAEMRKDIMNAYKNLEQKHDFLVCEGTGHVGVGDIGGVSNAVVAASVGTNVILVAEGGLGSAFDELSINKAACDAAGTNILGVVLNKVIPSKVDMITDYFQRAISQWDFPLLGVIPYTEELTFKANYDVERLFNCSMHEDQRRSHLLNHPSGIQVAASSLNTFIEDCLSTEDKHSILNRAIVIDESRTDIIEFLCHNAAVLGNSFKGIIIVSSKGERAYRSDVESLYSNYPCIVVPDPIEKVVSKYVNNTAKFNEVDLERTGMATQVVNDNFDFDLMMRLLK